MNIERVFTYFDEITCIPRTSGEEWKIADYLESNGRKMNLDVYRDEKDNVILKKRGSRGNSPCVVLQAHSDMVWESVNEGGMEVKIPKGIHIKNGKMKTRGTVLGADDGIGMALILALLEEEGTEFPAIEAVFTTNEEETMGGAIALNKRDLFGTHLINLDSEKEGTFTIGAAGGISIACMIPTQRKMAHFTNGLSIHIKGGRGGHSGLEIHNKRVNPIQLLIRILQNLPNQDFELFFMQGGSRSNAIPESAQALINTDNTKELAEKVKDCFNRCSGEWCDEETNLMIEVEEISSYNSVYENPEKLLLLLENLPHGVYSRTDDFIFSSVNLALLNEVEGGLFTELSLRSSYKSWYIDEAKRIGRLVIQLGGNYEVKDEYAAWMCNKNSELLNYFKKSYRELFGREAISENVHAGVECGIIMENCPSIVDAISIGPTIHGAHTINEELDIASVDRVYRLLKDALIKLNQKGELCYEK